MKLMKDSNKENLENSIKYFFCGFSHFALQINPKIMNIIPQFNVLLMGISNPKKTKLYKNLMYLLDNNEITQIKIF